MNDCVWTMLSFWKKSVVIGNIGLWNSKAAIQGVLKICSKLLFNFIEITIWHWCSPVNLLHIFRIPFTKNTSGWLLLEIIKNDVKSYMDYSHLVAFIIFIISLILTPYFYFGLLAWLLRAMPLLRKLKNRLLGLNHVVFLEKIENRTFGSEAYCFFHDIIVNGNMFQ